MSKFEIVGIQAVDYTSRKTNQRVTGTNLFLQYEDNGINGYGTEQVYVSDRLRDGQVFQLGDIVQLVYNRYGRIEQIIKE